MTQKEAQEKRIEYQNANRERLAEIKKELKTADATQCQALLTEAWELYQWYPGRGY